MECASSTNNIYIDYILLEVDETNTGWLNLTRKSTI